jgi:hypothetical protein
MIMVKTSPLVRIATILGWVLIGLLSAVANSYGQPVKIIVDTDMLTDPEDVNALWLLNTLADRGEAEILACVVNGHETNRASGAAVDVVNTWLVPARSPWRLVPAEQRRGFRSCGWR